MQDARFGLLSLDDEAIYAGIEFMERYSVNATDASILALFLRYTRSIASTKTRGLLLVSDHRLREAAAAEGMATLDPESVSPHETAARLAGA